MNSHKQTALWQAIYNGKDYSLEKQVIVPMPESLDALSHLIPGGAYTTFRTFNHYQALHLDRHFERLQTSAQLAAITVSLSNRSLRSAIRHTLQYFSPDEARIRLTLDLEKHQGEIYISLETLSTPTVLQYQQGINAVTRRLHRQNPQAKLTNFISTASQTRGEVGGDIYEVLMINDEGLVLEGLTSNFFAIKNGELWTPAEGILPGLTRAIVLEEACTLGMSVREQGVCIADISTLQEAFITSVSRGVLPMVKIDTMLIGNGLPGVLTQKLMTSYNERITSELEDI